MFDPLRPQSAFWILWDAHSDIEENLDWPEREAALKFLKHAMIHVSISKSQWPQEDEAHFV